MTDKTVIATDGAAGHAESVLVSQQGSRFLAVLLPGAGYTCDRPLLYYSGVLALECGGDLLRLDYGEAEPDKEHFASIVEAAADAIRQAEKPEHLMIVLIAKSFGTLVAGKLMNRLRRPTKLVLFTPIRATLPIMNGDRFIAFSGTADPYLTTDDIERWFGRSHKNYHLYGDANHSLEIEGDTNASIEILSDALNRIEAFLWAR